MRSHALRAPDTVQTHGRSIPAAGGRRLHSGRHGPFEHAQMHERRRLGGWKVLSRPPVRRHSALIALPSLLPDVQSTLCERCGSKCQQGRLASFFGGTCRRSSYSHIQCIHRPKFDTTLRTCVLMCVCLRTHLQKARAHAAVCESNPVCRARRPRTSASFLLSFADTKHLGSD